MPVYYQQPQDDFIARFLASMQERAAYQREQEARQAELGKQQQLSDLEAQLRIALERGDVKSAQGLMGQRFPDSNIDLMAGARETEKQTRLAEEKKLEEERRRLSWDTDNNMGLVREDQIAPNGAVQALMDVLGLGGEAAPVQANVAAPNREKAFAQMAARYPEMPAARLDTLKNAIMQTGDEERQSSLIGGKLAPSWEESNIKLPESEATINKLNAEANEARVSASESKDRMEGGFYVTLTGRNGEILGMYNPKGGPDGKGRFISAEEIQKQGGINEPLRRGPLSTAELTRQGFLDQMLTQLDQVERQAGNNKESVGGLLGWRGTVSALKKKVGGSDPELQERGLAVAPEVADMLRTVESMKDALLRAKSGAQINEQEYKRLSKLVPDPSSASFWEDLSSLRNELKRLTEVTTGSDFNKETGRDKRKADKRYNPATGQFEEVKN